MNEEELNAYQIGLFAQVGIASAVENVISRQKDAGQPIYVICRWWLGSFSGIEEFSTEGDADLEGLKALYGEKYGSASQRAGSDEYSFTLEKLTISRILG